MPSLQLIPSAKGGRVHSRIEEKGGCRGLFKKREKGAEVTIKRKKKGDVPDGEGRLGTFRSAKGGTGKRFNEDKSPKKQHGGAVSEKRSKRTTGKKGHLTSLGGKRGGDASASGVSIFRARSKSDDAPIGARSPVTHHRGQS